jgi:hypothetical protein
MLFRDSSGDEEIRALRRRVNRRARRVAARMTAAAVAGDARILPASPA